jgi:hypothetical protein
VDTKFQIRSELVTLSVPCLAPFRVPQAGRWTSRHAFDTAHTAAPHLVTCTRRMESRREPTRSWKRRYDPVFRAWHRIRGPPAFPAVSTALRFAPHISGAPMILYGDGAGINGTGADPFNARALPLDGRERRSRLYDSPDQTMLDCYTRLGRLRAQLPVLKNGSFMTLLTGDATRASGDDDVYAFLRAGGAGKPVVVVLSPRAQRSRARRALSPSREAPTARAPTSRPLAPCRARCAAPS